MPILSHLITLNTLKRQEYLGFYPLEPLPGPYPRHHTALIIASQSLFPLKNSIFFHKTDISLNA